MHGPLNVKVVFVFHWRFKFLLKSWNEGNGNKICSKQMCACVVCVYVCVVLCVCEWCVCVCVCGFVCV